MTDSSAGQDHHTAAHERTFTDFSPATDICTGRNGYEAADCHVMSDRAAYVQLGVSAY
jgi:hypothetical protein